MGQGDLSTNHRVKLVHKEIVLTIFCKVTDLIVAEIELLNTSNRWYRHHYFTDPNSVHVIDISLLETEDRPLGEQCPSDARFVASVSVHILAHFWFGVVGFLWF